MTDERIERVKKELETAQGHYREKWDELSPFITQAQSDLASLERELMDREGWCYARVLAALADYESEATRALAEAEADRLVKQAEIDRLREALDAWDRKSPLARQQQARIEALEGFIRGQGYEDIDYLLDSLKEGR